MLFKEISINNFRNFESIKIDLTNKNVFFGLNDVGKTNFLYAIRFVFDREVRKKGFIDSDFHKKKIGIPIEIIVKIQLSEDCQDSEKLRSRLKGSLLSSQNVVFIKLKVSYNTTELFAIPTLYWGGDVNNLTEMSQRGYMYDIDYIANVIYVDSYIDLDYLFKKNIKKLVKENDEEDRVKIELINSLVKQINSGISDLSGIKDFERKVTPEFRSFRNDSVEVSLKSEMAVNGWFSNVLPYINEGGSEDIYPTSGEGRRKLLAYAILNLLAKETRDRKINLYLIEEPENHLHKSIQISLSKQLFEDDKYPYVFLTTHSPYVLYEMDDVNLIRIHNSDRIESHSQLYEVPIEYKKNKNILNKDLTEAIFSDKVLIVEGPSEVVLFKKILSEIDPFYEINGKFICPINGVGFTKYIEILSGLKIPIIIKTDNDLAKVKGKDEFSVLGFRRINRIIDNEQLPIDNVNDNTVDEKNKLYQNNISKIDFIRSEYKVYLSKVDLENDLDEVLHEKMCEYLEVEKPIKFLQERKLYNMYNLVGYLTLEDCKTIYESYNFACLKELML